jgi:serine/threonine protein kinase
MDYPRPSDIIAAVRDPQFIKDNFFEGCAVKILETSRPEMYSGGFSLVFPIWKGAEKWAFKVWHTRISKNQERYIEIVKHLEKINLPYFLNVHYVSNGLLVLGQFLDTCRMGWVEGLNLSEYISANLNGPDILQKLASDFLKLTKDLHSNSISHGDLQHENLIVTHCGKIKIIDYDTICVPSFDGHPCITRGREGYQHPCRLISKPISSLRVDHFSELVIYISILAVSENPILWDKYNAIKAERLLFSQRDFLNFSESEIMKDLMFLSTNIRELVKLMEEYIAAYLLLRPIHEI